jgi:LmbE family N-acetylglucosaminyl deacetylase
MNEELRLMLVLAHPDDESLGNGGTIARYVSEGVKVHLVTATRGEQGWFGPPEDYPGPDELGRIREAELRAAATVLGIEDVTFLDYRDGELPEAPAGEVVAKIVREVRRVRPQVVITFDPNGAYGHPDHIAITQHTTAAVAAAGDPAFEDDEGRPPHHVSKLYYMVWSRQDMALYESAFGELVMEIDGEPRRSVTWEDWAITTRIDARAHWRRAWEAIQHHRTQLPGYQRLLALPEERHEELWGGPSYYRVFSRVSVGRGLETDLFEGLRPFRESAATAAAPLAAVR